MWFSYRGQEYRIGYAESEDGVRWRRMDERWGLGPSSGGWDSCAVAYPHVFTHAGRRYMLYCGNVYGETGFWIRSEACLRLDLGTGRLPGMLVLGAEDPHQFKPNQGTDLLTFFAGVFERAMRRWLS